jgi:hypothetical protein
MDREDEEQVSNCPFIFLIPPNLPLLKGGVVPLS